MTSLAVIIVNWNAGEQLRQCLQSVLDSKRDSWILEKVVVVDNASADNSLQTIDDLPLPSEIIRNDRNLGFAAACNQGARESDADQYLFLNPDARVEQDAIEKSVVFLNAVENRQVGIVGGQMVDDSGNVARTCARRPHPQHFLNRSLGLDMLCSRLFPTYLMKDWDHGNTTAVDHVIGAFYLVRREVFQQLKGFDERFFVYLEDLDFSVRALDAGWSVHFLSDVKIFHKGGGTSEQVRATRLFYSLRSRIHYVFKHFGPVSAFFLTSVILFIEPFPRMFLALLKGSPGQIQETIYAYFKLWGDLIRSGNKKKAVQ